MLDGVCVEDGCQQKSLHKSTSCTRRNQNNTPTPHPANEISCQAVELQASFYGTLIFNLQRSVNIRACWKRMRWLSLILLQRQEAAAVIKTHMEPVDMFKMKLTRRDGHPYLCRETIPRPARWVCSGHFEICLDADSRLVRPMQPWHGERQRAAILDGIFK